MIPLCYFPNQIIFLDDNEEVLNSFKFMLDYAPEICSYYSNSNKCLQDLNSYKADPLTERYIKEIDISQYHQRAYKFNIYHLYQEIYNGNRFKQISCIVIDHDMPGMKGLEICQNITDKHIKKIMLTGIADHQMAIDAFNKGIIDGFISKADPEMHQKLSKTINEAKLNYFRELTAIPEHSIKHEQTPTILFEPGFQEIFANFVKNYKIVEYYLFEMFGSFILLDEEGKIYGLFVVPEDEIDDWVEEATSEKSLSEAAIADLRSRKKIICHWLKENEQDFPPLAEREKLIRPANKFVGNSGVFYYAWTDDLIELDRKRIVSFKDFKNINP